MVCLRSSWLKFFLIDRLECIKQGPKCSWRCINDTLSMQRNYIAHKFWLLEVLKYCLLQLLLSNIYKWFLGQLWQPNNSTFCENICICSTILSKFFIFPIHRKYNFKISFNSFQKSFIKGFPVEFLLHFFWISS